MPLAVGTKAPDFTLSTKTARRAETNQAQRQFRREKRAAAFLSHGVHGHLHDGDV